jgi:ATP-dependent Zn protease
MFPGRIETKPRRSEWQTAYHEAGHGVVGLDLGLSLGRHGITIVPDEIEQSLGSAHFLHQLRERPDISVSPRTHVRIEKYAVMCMAGDVAQKKFCPQRHYGGKSDLQEAADLLAFISESSDITKARMNVALRQAQYFVNHHWDLIEAVAAVLIERKTMNVKQLQEVLRGTIFGRTRSEPGGE